MHYYSVVEGEGIAGPETAVSAMTTALYSCIGIVMRNTDLHFAGLYHYPANAIKSDFTQRTILQMLNDLVPTQIFLTARSTGGVLRFFEGATKADRNAVHHFLNERLPHAIIEWMPDDTFSSYEMVDDEFTVNNATSNLLTASRSKKLKTATKLPNHHGRKIDANTFFYGGEYGGEPRKASKHD